MVGAEQIFKTNTQNGEHMKKSIMGVKVEWLIRARRNMQHKGVGRTLAGNQDDMADESMLRYEVKTSDGVWPLWSCGERSFADSKAIVLDYLQLGAEVFLYKKVGDADPYLFEDEEIREAMAKIGKPSVTSPEPKKKTKAFKEAEKRLKELKKRRKFPGVH